MRGIRTRRNGLVSWMSDAARCVCLAFVLMLVLISRVWTRLNNVYGNCSLVGTLFTKTKTKNNGLARFYQFSNFSGKFAIIVCITLDLYTSGSIENFSAKHFFARNLTILCRHASLASSLGWLVGNKQCLELGGGGGYFLVKGYSGDVPLDGAAFSQLGWL